MTQSDTQSRIFAEFAALARTLGQTHRLALLEHVAQGERSVERLAELTGLSMANASQHLQHLKRAGFVAARRSGKHVLYRLGDGPVMPLIAALRRYAEHNRAEIRRLVADSDGPAAGLERMSCSELVDRLREGEVTLLDVRPPEEFALGHLPGAINIPLEALEARLAELPAGRHVVAYCRGPYCVLSAEAVRSLTARGISAVRLSEGFPEWKAAGLPVATAG